jgi:hypothetical protein
LLLNVTCPIKLPAEDGVKLTTTTADPFAGTVNSPPEAMANASPATVAVPLKLAGPEFVTVNIACADEPAATAPKSWATGAAVKAAGTLPGSSGSDPKVYSSRFV